MNDMRSRGSRKVAVLGPIPRDQIVTHAGERFHKPSHPGGWSRGRENGHGAGRGGWGSLPLRGWRSCWRAGARVGESECGLPVTPADFGIRTRPQA